MASDARDQLAEHLKFFAELGVSGYSKDPAWQSREQEPARRAGLAPQPEARPALLTTMPDDLAAIRADIGDCTRCKLCRLGRTQIVFGVGNPNADLMFVGEAPGRDEDLQGYPFVGR